MSNSDNHNENDSLGNVLHSVWSFLNHTFFHITRKGKELIMMPTWAFAIIMLIFWHTLVPIMLVAYLFGFRYSFDGNRQADEANGFLDKAGSFIAGLESSLKNKEKASEETVAEAASEPAAAEAPATETESPAAATEATEVASEPAAAEAPVAETEVPAAAAEATEAASEPAAAEASDGEAAAPAAEETTGEASAQTAFFEGTDAPTE